MKKSSKSVSPFILLLIPALLVIGLKSTSDVEVEPEKQQASTYFQMPCLKGMIKAFF